jgi:TPR repeat protein
VDFDKAVYWLHKAAAQGEEDALKELRILRYNGLID